MVLPHDSWLARTTVRHQISRTTIAAGQVSQANGAWMYYIQEDLAGGSIQPIMARR